jgi:hypothetical protein
MKQNGSAPACAYLLCRVPLTDLFSRSMAPALVMEVYLSHFAQGQSDACPPALRFL